MRGMCSVIGMPEFWQRCVAIRVLVCDKGRDRKDEEEWKNRFLGNLIKQLQGAKAAQPDNEFLSLLGFNLFQALKFTNPENTQGIFGLFVS